MMRVTFFFFFCLFAVSQAWINRFSQRDIQQEHHEKYIQENPKYVPPSYSYFNQTIDHFNEQNQKTFSQRYLVNDTFWDGTGPVFLLIGGESALPYYAISDSFYMCVVWAQKFSALVVALEHRYYGLSQPFTDLSTENLQYLNVEQALADLAEFRQFIANKFKAQNNVWIGFGGSYPGMLAGWFRMKYPHLIDAAVASSAPVNVVVDFHQYLEVVENDLINVSNGSKECINNIYNATQTIQTEYTQENGPQNLQKLFKLCTTPEGPNDLSTMLFYLSGEISSIIQYNLQQDGWKHNMASICANMTNPKNTPIVNYAQFSFGYRGNYCLSTSYQNLINYYRREQITEGSSFRQWLYQTCTQFGFFQDSDYSNSTFGLFNVSFIAGMCRDTFNFTFAPDVKWIQTEFGGNNTDTSNVLWVNGSVDPWHALGILDAPSNATYGALFIQGTSHCADMNTPSDIAPPTLRPAQILVRNQVAEWVNNLGKNE